MNGMGIYMTGFYFGLGLLSAYGLLCLIGMIMIKVYTKCLVRKLKKKYAKIKPEGLYFGQFDKGGKIL